MKIEIMLRCGGRVICPAVEEGVTWVTERRGVPGVLKFSAAAQELEELKEGDAVTLYADGKALFAGFIFKIVRTNDETVQITAYDQMRYLKNRDSYLFEAMTASERIRLIAQDFGLQLGRIADTGYVLPARVEENAALIDMMLGALDSTLAATGRLYHLWDEAGRLTLADAQEMITGVVLDAEGGQGYSFESSIDSESYNRIKLVYEDEKAGARQVTIAQDASSMEKWGTLQYFEVLPEDENAQARAQLLLSLYNAPDRSLRLSGMAGDVRVHAGCMVVVQLKEIGVNGLMLVEKCCHRFEHGFHTMELELRK